jgi:methionyl-tRNA formyltransferase
VHNHVRGLSPYPAAWTLLPRAEGDELNVKVFATRLTNMPCVAGTCADVDCAAPGAVRVDGGHLYVATADNWIEILSLQPAGKRRMEADEFLRGYHLKCE